MRPRAPRRTLICLVLLLSTACGDEGSLRTEQAEELRHLCQSLAVRAGRGPEMAARIGQWDLERFRVGRRGGIERGADVVLTGMCIR
jgi:hypothetical protein